MVGLIQNTLPLLFLFRRGKKVVAMKILLRLALLGVLFTLSCVKESEEAVALELQRHSDGCDSCRQKALKTMLQSYSWTSPPNWADWPSQSYQSVVIPMKL